MNDGIFQQATNLVRKKCDETHPVCGYCKSKKVSCIWPTEKVRKSEKRKSNNPRNEAKASTKSTSKFCPKLEDGFGKKLGTTAVENSGTAISHKQKSAEGEEIKHLFNRSFSNTLNKETLTISELYENGCNVDDSVSLSLDNQILTSNANGSDGWFGLNFEEIEEMKALEVELKASLLYTMAPTSSHIYNLNEE